LALLLTLPLLLALLLSAAACGQNAATTTTAAATAAATEAQITTAGTEGAAATEAQTTAAAAVTQADAATAAAQTTAAETATTIAAAPADRPTIHIFGSRSVNSPEDRNSMQLVQDWSNAVNVSFEWELVATGYEETKSLKLASGDWPDVFMSVTDAEIIRYGSEGVFIPLQDLQAQYAPQLSGYYESNPAMKAYLTAPDGNIYTFPFYSIGPWGGINRLQVINTTWLEKLGLKMPTTLQEYKDVLIAFRDQDPNGNGQKDEVPFSWAGALDGHHPGGWAFSPDFTSASFQCPIPYDNNWMQYQDGKVVFIPVMEEYRNWVRWMGELYAEGLLDQQGFTQGTDQYAAKLNSEPYTVGVASVWDIGDSFTSPTAYDDYDFVPPLLGLNGEAPVVQYNLGYGGRNLWAVTKSCENVEAVIRAADYGFQEDIGAQFLEGPYDVRLIPDTICNQPGARVSGPAPEGMDNSAWRDSVALFGAAPVYFGLDQYKRLLHLHYTDHKVEYINTIMDPYKDPDPMPPFFMSLEETEAKSNIWTDLCEYVGRKGAEFVINNNVDAEWDAYVAELQKIGYQKAVDAQQAAVDRATN
jgi:putative aldouronate transport system substrate-binding protein